MAQLAREQASISIARPAFLNKVSTTVEEGRAIAHSLRTMWTIHVAHNYIGLTYPELKGEENRHKRTAINRMVTILNGPLGQDLHESSWDDVIGVAHLYRRKFHLDLLTASVQRAVPEAGQQEEMWTVAQKIHRSLNAVDETGHKMLWRQRTREMINAAKRRRQ